ncbi:MAG: DUF2834 domain-containing protein [Bacteroidia bacterium]
MKKSTIYLILAILGFIAPSILVAMESIETGNILLYANPVATVEGMFANRISSIFLIDLLFAILVFIYWTYNEAKTHKIKNIWHVWLLTFLLGFAGGFPYFLFLRQKSIDRS